MIFSVSLVLYEKYLKTKKPHNVIDLALIKASVCIAVS